MYRQAFNAPFSASQSVLYREVEMWHE